MLKALSYQPTCEPQGQDFSRKVVLNPSGIKTALKDLHRMDIVFHDEENFYLVQDPAVSYFMRKSF